MFLKSHSINSQNIIQVRKNANDFYCQNKIFHVLHTDCQRCFVPTAISRVPLIIHQMSIATTAGKQAKKLEARQDQATPSPNSRELNKQAQHINAETQKSNPKQPSPHQSSREQLSPLQNCSVQPKAPRPSP
jgi:hypothetical protein